MSTLPYKTQKEIVYNKYLPYNDKLDGDSDSFLAEIKYNLGRALIFREASPGILYWSNRLTNYIKLYGRKFTKEDHLSFVNIYFELLTTPDLDAQFLLAFSHVLALLLKKRELISRDELVLPWRPLYNIVESVFYSKYKITGLKRLPMKLEHALRHVIAVSRVYFSVDSTQEMLDEWRPLMCPFDVTFGKAMFYFKLFLPTTLLPQEYDKGFRLWMDELLGIWHACTNIPGWEEHCLQLFARLAKDTIGHIDWNPHMSTVFTRLLKSLSVPVGKHKTQHSKGDFGIIASSIVLIISTMGSSSETQNHLNKLFQALESFYHPSNITTNSVKLQRLLFYLPKEMVKRLHRERFAQDSWEPAIPKEAHLTEEELLKFVECLKPSVILSVFHKSGSFEAAGALHNLALIKPDVVMPTLLDKLYTALETVTEPHQLTATLSCVTSVARSLVQSDQSYSEGRSHVMPLLHMVLPGIDPNDFRKAMRTFTFLSTIISLIPVVDCSEAVGVLDLSEDEKELCFATGRFEDFVLQFMDRCFVMIENSSFEDTSELESGADQRNSQEGMMGMGVASTFHTIIMQSSPKIFTAALDQLFRFCSTKLLETKVAGRMASDMCRAAAKTNPEETLRKFLPHCCSIIEHLTSVEEIKDEEEVDDQLLWNLQIVTELVRSNGPALLKYKEQLIKILHSTIHLRCKEAATLAASLLVNALKSLSQIYPLEWRNVVEDFGKSPTEHLFIRDWGKPGDVHNLCIQWHNPSREEKLFVKELFDLFLQPELKRLERVVEETETLSREELQQSLNIVISCLTGAALLLPELRGVALENVGVKTMVSRGRLPNTIYVGPDVPMGEENSRVRIAELIHRLLDHLLVHHEDHTKALEYIVKIYSLLMLYIGAKKDEFDLRWQSANAVKMAMENKLSGRKKHVRALLIERVQLQHEMRILDRASTQLSSMHKVLLDDLFRLSTTVYTEIRIKAQRVIASCINTFDYFARTLLPSVMAKMQENPEVSHEEFKGALYIIQNSHMLYLSVHYWEIMVDVWPAIVKADHSEKPSIVTLISTIAGKMVKQYDTVAISREVSDSAVRCGEQLLKSSNPVPRSLLKPPTDANASLLPCKDELKLAAQMHEERRERNLRSYHSLVDTLVSLLETDTRWRYLQICFKFLHLLVRFDLPLPSSAVGLCVRFLNHDSLAIRKIAINAVGAILKQQKRPHVKIPVNRLASGVVAESTPGNIQPGDRPDNHWLHFVSENLPKSREEWEVFTFIDKTHWGYYTWPKNVLTYAPVTQQPALGRKREELNKAEVPIYDAFSQEDFISKLLAYFSLEDRKGKDKFDFRRFLLFKGLFRNFDDAFLDKLKPHLERLCADSQESNQRCGVEIIAALVRGCKHWTYDKSEKLWDMLLPLMKKAILCISVESLRDWGTCMATAVESRDPRRIHRFLSMLLEDPLSEDGGSFTVSCRLYLAQGALSQQEWRVGELLHKFLNQIERQLHHSYKNVRDTMGSVLGSTLMFDLQMSNSLPSKSPHVREFVQRTLPQLSGLQELAHEREVAAEKDLNDSSEESDGRKDSIKRLKTVTVWLFSHALRTLQSCPREFFDLLPVIILFDSQEDDPELQQYCSRTIAYMSQMELPSSSVQLALDAVKQIGSNSSWHARRSLLQYVQVMVFHNIFCITQNSQYVQDIKELVLKLLVDEQLEVREVAAKTLSGLVHYRLFDLDKEMQAKFRKMANTKLPKKKRAGVASNNVTTDNSLIHRHAGVLGLASCVQAFPYDVPEWMPQMLLDLGEHLHDPNPVQATVKKVMTDFRRTHHDNWQEHKQKFTEDQLVVLTDLLVSPCYYA